MRTAIRLAVFAAIVLVIALTLAPPLAGQVLDAVVVGPLAPGARDMQQLPAPAPADPSGTYSGTVTPAVAAEPPVNGTIVVRLHAGTLVVTAGPDIEQQFDAQDVVREGDAITFDVLPPGDGSPLLRFAVRIDGRKLTGTVSRILNGGTMTGSLDFSRQ